MLTEISNRISNDESWITVELNPNRDLLTSLAAKLYSIRELQLLFVKAKLDFSFLGIGATIEGGRPVTDIEATLDIMLEHLSKAGKRLLITIDEVTNNEHIQTFCHTYQMLVRKDYEVYLLMTGLFENIYDLQNEKSLTFLYRAPKLILDPLNFTSMRADYQSTLEISLEEAERLAILTKGYSFAYQVLGYLYWDKKSTGQTHNIIESILPKFDAYLQDYVYEKIWSELSPVDIQVVSEIAKSGNTKVQDIREGLQMSSAKFSMYRDRLLRKGIITSPSYGQVALALPRFDVFANGMSAEMGFTNMK